MQDHGDDENMNTLTTIRIPSYATDLHDAPTCPGEESDTESFHSAITSATRGTTNVWSRAKESHKTHTYMIKYESRKNGSSRPGTATTAKVSDDTNAESQSSRPSSRRSSKPSLSVPRRKSSLAKKRAAGSKRVKPATLHRQSCQIFSSLDGVLALSREITPLPSVSSSRSTTRHPSLIPEENNTTFTTNGGMAQMCEKIDAKLAYTYSYSYSLDTDSTASFPLHHLAKSDIKAANPDAHHGQIKRLSSSSRRPGEPPSEIPEPGAERPAFNTVISWTSDATRRQEYAKIDRATRGIRGLLRRLVPKSILSRNSRRLFFTGKCDGDSVRRFRMDVADDDDDSSRVNGGGGDGDGDGHGHPAEHSAEPKESAPLDRTSPTEAAISTGNEGERERERECEQERNRNEHDMENQRRTPPPPRRGK